MELTRPEASSRAAIWRQIPLDTPLDRDVDFESLAAIESGDKNEAELAYKEAVPAIDRSVSKGLMHRNKAARHKSRLNKHVRSL